jgi:CheY-like chemotaxis protein
MMCKRHGRRTQARILVADWDQTSALASAAIMRRAGFKVATACDGIEAVNEAASFRPDLLVAEPFLGRLSGIDVAVQTISAFPDCKVLFLSSEASMADIARTAPMELIYSYTAKPIHPLDLLNAVTYLVCAEWSGGPIDHDTPEQGTAKTTTPRHSPAVHPEPPSEMQTSFPDAPLQQHYLRSPLDLKRHHADRHIRSRHHHAPAYA